MRDARDAPQRRYFHALQNTFKILINSFYGYLGFAQGNFADFEAAARVTQIGRDLLKKMIEWLKAQGAQVIEVDTDGIYFVPPDTARDSIVGRPSRPPSPHRKHLHNARRAKCPPYNRWVRSDN